MPTHKVDYQPLQPSHEEHILVVKRDILLTSGSWHGLRQDNFDSTISLVTHHREFYARSLMEQDTSFKQIIPYLIFQYQDQFFLMQRRANASAQALQNKFSLGIGGHVRQEDMQQASIFEWARREFYEEVAYDGSLTIRPLGIINDDTNDIGKVHIGFALVLEGNSANISIKTEHKSGTLLTLKECAAFYNRMETWSQFIFDALNK